MGELARKKRGGSQKPEARSKKQEARAVSGSGPLFCGGRGVEVWVVRFWMWTSI
jgi:hypothetical protein